VIAFAKRTFAEILYSLKPADPEIADRAILEAIKIQQEICAKPEIARSYVSYAHLLKKMGREKKAKKYLAEAIDMFQQMGMSWDSTQANQLKRDLRA
jgi:hypothetical protein